MGKPSFQQQSRQRGWRSRSLQRTIGPSESVSKLGARASVTQAVANRTRSKASRIRQTNRLARQWKMLLTTAPSRLRHRLTGLPAGYGLFVACPSCKFVRKHRRLPRHENETDETYWARAQAAASNACKEWGRRGASEEEMLYLRDSGWTKPVFLKDAFVGEYSGIRKDADTVGDYVMRIDHHLLPSVPLDGAYCIDGASGSLMKYCNGTKQFATEQCNIKVQESKEHPARHFGAKGRSAVPVVAARDLYPHDELIMCYGEDFCAGIPGYDDYVMT